MSDSTTPTPTPTPMIIDTVVTDAEKVATAVETDAAALVTTATSWPLWQKALAVSAVVIAIVGVYLFF